MQLTYRGVAYQPSTISIALPPSKLTGKYRGQGVNINSTVPRLLQPSVALKYRGVVYPRQAAQDRSLERAIAI